MRYSHLIGCLCSILIGFPCCCVAALPITTMVGDPPPTTASSEQTSVLLLPFNAVGQNGENAWISQAIQEDLSHDLSRNRAIRVIKPATTQPVASADGLVAARDAKADRLISGSYQVVDDQLRINANVIDINQTQLAGEVKATGRVRDLFQLEDSLATQIWHILPQPADASASDFQVTPLEDYVATQQTASSPVYEAPAAQVSPPVVYDSGANDYLPYESAYPYGSGFGYGYSYGLGFPFFIRGGSGHGFYHHGGGFHGGVGAVGTRAPLVVHPSTPRGFASPAIGGGVHFAGGHR